MRMKTSQRAGAPLVEIIIALGVFAVCSVVIVRLFLGAHFAALCSADRNQAVIRTETAIERLKSGAGDKAALEAAGFTAVAAEEGEALTAYYDADWNACQPADALFQLRLDWQRQGGLLEGTAACSRLKNYPFLAEERSALCTLDMALYTWEDRA